MKLKLIVDKLDGLDANVAALYSPRDDGKFALDVDGITDPKSVENTLKTERDARKAAEAKMKEFEERMKAFDGVDPVEAKTILARFANDEEFQLLKAGKTEVLRERWTEKMRKDHEKQVGVLQDAITKADERGGKWKSRVLDNEVRAAAAKVGIHSHAVEDALFRARSLFTLDDDGNAVQIRDGSPVLGKDGKTPYSPAEWLESLREAAPHWFPAMAAGSGASQSSRASGNNGQQRTVKRATFDGWTPKEKMAFSKEGGAVVE